MSHSPLSRTRQQAAAAVAAQPSQPSGWVGQLHWKRYGKWAQTLAAGAGGELIQALFRWGCLGAVGQRSEEL